LEPYRKINFMWCCSWKTGRNHWSWCI